MEGTLHRVLVCLAVPLLVISSMTALAPAALADDTDMYEVATMSEDDYGSAFQFNRCCCMLNGKDSKGKKEYYDATWSGFSDRLVSRLHEL